MCLTKPHHEISKIQSLKLDWTMTPPVAVPCTEDGITLGPTPDEELKVIKGEEESPLTQGMSPEEVMQFMRQFTDLT